MVTKSHHISVNCLLPYPPGRRLHSLAKSLCWCSAGPPRPREKTNRTQIIPRKLPIRSGQLSEGFNCFRTRHEKGKFYRVHHCIWSTSMLFCSNLYVTSPNSLNALVADRVSSPWALYWLIMSSSYPSHLPFLFQSILVDNSPHAYGYDLDNGIPIESWFDDPSDTELLKLADFLRDVTDVDDVRPIIKNHFRSFELVHNATLGFATVTSAPPF